MGQLVRCRVLEVERNEGRKTVRLSLNPKDVNSLIETSELRSGMV